MSHFALYISIDIIMFERDLLVATLYKCIFTVEGSVAKVTHDVEKEKGSS